MNIVNIEDVLKNIDRNKKRIIITGVTGQDGSHMVDYLLKNTTYIIFGGIRRLSVCNHVNIQHINSDRFHLINFDLTDTNNINNIINKIQPDYFINYAAQSFVGCSWEFPKLTWEINSSGVLDILEAIRKYKPSCRLYQAGSSEEFGNITYTPQDEKHPLNPKNIYGASKVASRQLIKIYRDTYNIYAIQGWLYNHEGTRRGEEFVTRKITKNVARIYNAINKNQDFKPLEIGNIYIKRDWSDAEDFIVGVWKMLNQDIYNENYNGKPEEYILSSNELHTIKEFIELSFNNVNIKGYWENKIDNNPINIKYYYNDTDKVLVEINSSFYRLAEVDNLVGNSEKAQKELNWKPKTNFKNLVKKMVEHDLLSFT
jgi:GDPmannose 4,6-dehydratase